VICPACGRENPEGFQFCGFCGTALAEAPPGAELEERKVVSVLFCDLVGFTAAAERADPEDVRARLRPYHARVRTEIERFGGTVEKFVGDAVMAVFGAPVAYEDDAERAVRAGLRVLEAIDDLNATQPNLDLRVRIGINSGETVVELGARPELGEGIVAGDVVNTAARLQSAAPIGGIGVGELTYRQTERLFDYERLDPVRAKGRVEPVAVWRARAARARPAATRTVSLVGRAVEAERLRRTLDRTLHERCGRLLTIVGEPGIGKSRLLAELQAHVDGLAAHPNWLRGRCLPYGDGIAFWALGEIVKTHAGIFESDTAQAAADKLDAVLPDVEEKAWLRARLLPLLGIDSGQPASREESFTAWSSFLAAVADEGAVIVIEDLHWADAALLDFLSQLGERIDHVPLLVIGTARPELYDRELASAVRGNSETITLAPLSEEETAELVSTLIPPNVPQQTRQAILERANGNPLFAEEMARLLADTGLLEDGRADVPVPHSLQALIAARLDALQPHLKSLLQDAAVVGNVFWPTALTAIGGRAGHDIELDLQELARKELIRPSDDRSMKREPAYAFWHILVRDVSYAQISRPGRVRRHRAAAEWIEKMSGERMEDVADVVAHHYLAAFDLARAAGLEEGVGELQEGAIQYLPLGAARALPLDVASAEAGLAKALELASLDHPARALLLERWAEAAEQQGRLSESKAALEEAIDLYRKQGDALARGRALTVLSHLLQRLGDPRREEVLAEALDVLDGGPAGPERVAAYSQLAGRRYVGGSYREAIAAADEALALASELRLDPPPRALGFRGGSRACLGDRGGLLDMRRALELALEQGKGRDAAVIYANLSIELLQYEGPQAALDACLEGIEFSERRGIAAFAASLAGESTNYLLDLGRVDEALQQARDAAARAEAAGAVPELIETRSVELRVLAERGELDDEDLRAADALIAAARNAGEPQQLASALAAAARVYADQPQKANALLVELERVPAVRGEQAYATQLAELVRRAIAVGNRQLAARLIDGVDDRIPLFAHALCACRAQLAEAAGDHVGAATQYAEAVGRWREFRRVPELAYALLGLGRCLPRHGDDGADGALSEARELFSSLGYGPAIAETEVR
jgi:class 3 adenylate cyclase/tetratricopeptide (TPR) repeat protein